MYIVYAYIVYLLISLGVTTWVARTLHRNGRVLLLDRFHGNAALADSVNRPLIVGFLLVSLGYIAHALKGPQDLPNLRAAITLTGDSIGDVLVVLGITYLASISILSKMTSWLGDRVAERTA